MSWNRHLFQKEFGLELEHLFSSFNSNPVGSGTIAQVHICTLRNGGLEVAVKIAHPHVAEKIERDLQLIGLIAAVVDSMFPWLNIMEEAQYFSNMMHEQLDLRREAYTLAHFSRNFATWRTVSIPVPIYPYVSSSILMETFASGTSIAKFVRPWPGNSSPAIEHRITYELATIGLNSFLQMLLWDNFIHADLHPGNILVRFCDKKGKVLWTRGPSKELAEILSQNPTAHPQVVFLDTGMVTQLSRRDRKNFDDLFLALVIRGDGQLAGRLLIERSPASRASVINGDEFCRKFDGLVRPLFQRGGVGNLDLRRFTVAPLLIEVFDLVREHRIRLDGSFTNLVMSFMCMEGLGKQLAPDFNLIPMLVRGALQYLVTTAAIKVSETAERTLSY